MDHQYPIGRFEFPVNPTTEHHTQWISELATVPDQLETLVAGLSETQLSTPYREGGWTVRQVIHHLADSHMNAYCRTRLALTEDRPTVKSYEEKLWAELFDAKEAPVGSSVILLTALHERWVILLNSLSKSDWKRDVYIPHFDRYVTVEQIAGIYAWHGKHHLAHIELVK